MRARYDSQRRVQGFDEYLDLFERDPWRCSRDAARYLRDAFDHYGSYEVQSAGRTVRRFRLFDSPFDEDPNDGGPRQILIGHEDVQERFYRILSNFVREGAANKLVLLHGPNGTAKSTFAACLHRALEDYSTHDQGAVHRINWVFPRGREGRQNIGFGGSKDDGPRAGETFAHLGEDDIAARLADETRDHPLLLLPIQERRTLLRKAYDRAGLRDQPPDWLWYGDLSQKNRRILEALLVAYRGDLGKALAHVQVERWEMSRRYRQGAVTLGPQMAVDAGERQVTMDRSVGSLPASLASVTLYELFGELVDASGGVLEFADLLKRPLDAWRYLLLAIESGDVALTNSVLQLNCVLVASANEVHLAAFKEHHEFASFRGRLALVRMGHLPDYKREQQIYDRTVGPQLRRFVAPHATEVAALWAVLTRLRKPQSDSYPKRPSLGALAASLTPIEKAELLAKGEVPRRFGTEQAKELAGAIAVVAAETDSWPRYEGLEGASAREMRSLLFNAAQSDRYGYLSPFAVLDEIEALCKSPNDYAFLKEQAEDGYHDALGFVALLRARLLDQSDDDLRNSTGLVDESQYRELFERYVNHVSSWLKGEKILNRLTGNYESPDADLMASVEKMLEISGAGSASDSRVTDHRKQLISTIAAQAIDHPGEPIDYGRLFPRELDRLKERYFADRRKTIAAIARDIVALVRGEPGALDDERRERARRTLEQLAKRYGYDDVSAADAIAVLLADRYHV
ncbi:MAG: serine protein kinase PrkA [Deltaproteobacteria bacterium]|nr:serine protein kinase PrkA [Deltaproteobacteria bacterium]